MSTEELKTMIEGKIREKLAGELSCEDLLRLSAAAAELEKNDMYKAILNVSQTPYVGFNGPSTGEVKNDE